MKKYKLVRFYLDKKAASVPKNWIVKNNNIYECFWPLYGLKRKLRDCVPPPLETDVTERRKWKLLKCIVLTEREYSSYEEADAAISSINFSEEDLSLSELCIGEPAASSSRVETLVDKQVPDENVADVAASLSDKVVDDILISMADNQVSGEHIVSSFANLLEKELGDVCIGQCTIAKRQLCIGEPAASSSRAETLVDKEVPAEYVADVVTYENTHRDSAAIVSVAAASPSDRVVDDILISMADNQVPGEHIVSSVANLPCIGQRKIAKRPVAVVSNTLLEKEECVSNTTANRFEEELGLVSIGLNTSSKQRCQFFEKCVGSVAGEPSTSGNIPEEELGAACICPPHLTTKQPSTVVTSPFLENEEFVGSTKANRFEEELGLVSVGVNTSSKQLCSLLEKEKCVCRSTDQMIQVNILKRPKPFVREDVDYKNLLLELQIHGAYQYLLEIYVQTFARNIESFAETIIYLTFKDNMVPKIVFREYKDRINIDGSILLQCMQDAIISKYKTEANEARDFIFDTCKRLRNNESQRICVKKRKLPQN